MKKLITILFLIGLSLNSFGQIDITKRKVTLDSLKARNDSVYLRSPMTGQYIKSDTLEATTYIGVSLSQPIDSLTLNPNIPSPQDAYVFKIFADSATNLIGYFLDGDINPTWINVSQNTPVFNNTSDTLKALTPVSAGVITFSTPNPIITVVPCRADSVGLAELFVGIVIEDIPPGKIGKIAGFDFIAQVNTSQWEVGDRLYVSADTSELVNVRPMGPFYSLFVGTVFVKDASTGVIGVNVQNFTDTDTETNLEGVINGIITQEQAIRDTIISNILYFETYNTEDITRNLPFIYSGKRYNLNTTTNTGTNGYARIALTFGTATSAQTNFIYIDYNSGSPQLAISTSAFPADGIRLGECNVYDQITHELYGFGSFQRFNNSMDGSTTDGWISKASKRIRLNGSVYESPGIDPTFTIVIDGVNKDSVNATTTSGIIWQFNKQPYQAQTIKRYLWLNSPTGERWITDLNEVDSTEAGVLIHTGNTNRYGLNIFAIQNSGDFNDFLAVTTPTNIYATDDNAISDASNFAVTNVPNKYSKVAVRLYRLVLRYQAASGGTITNVLGAGAYQDERGFLLGHGGSGAGSGGAVTDFSDADLTIFNSVDPTKISQFDASSITTGTTRTYGFPDKSGEIAIIVGDSLNVSGNIIGDTIKADGYIGKNGLGKLIASDNEIARFYSNGIVEQLIINPLGDLTGTAAAPSLAFGDGNTGFYERADNLLSISLGGGLKWEFATVKFTGTASFNASVMSEVPTSTNPGFTFSADEGTGIGRAGTGQLSLIANSIEAMRLTEDTVFVDSTISVSKIKFSDGTEQITAGGVLTGALQVAKSEILYTNTSQTTIITLPIDAVISNIGLEVTILFDDSGTDLLDIGITGTGDLYVNNKTLASVGSGNFINGFLGAPNDLDAMTGGTNITFTYTGQNVDATQGTAYVYIYYTIF